jgi:uncharacterized membrane protein/uncharacterized protein (DUF2141 family)
MVKYYIIIMGFVAMMNFLSKNFILYSIALSAIFINSVIGISHETLWYDESYSAAIINHSISDIWVIAGSDSHPPLYFILLKFFCFIFGQSELSLRLFSVLGTMLLSSLAFGPVARIFNKSTSFVYLFLIFTVPAFLTYSQEARMYTWAAYFVTAALLYGYLALKRGTTSDHIYFFSFSLMAAYIHYYALIAVIFIRLVIIIKMFCQKVLSRKVHLISTFLLIVLYIPWIFSFLGQLKKISKDFWIQPVSYLGIINTLLYPFESKFLPALLIPAIIILVLFITLIIYGLKRSTAADYKSKEVCVIAIIVYILTISTGVIFSLVVCPVYIERYSICIIGIVVLPAAYGISKINKKSLKILICLFLFLLLLPQNIHIRTQRLNGPMKEVEEYLKQRISSDDIFLHNDEHTFGTFCYYIPKNKQFLYYKTGEGGYSGFDAFRPNGTVVRDVDSIIKGKKKIWLVSRLGTASAGIANSWLNKGKFNELESLKIFLLPKSLYGVTLRLVEPGDGIHKVQPQSGKIIVNIKNLHISPGKVTVRLLNKEGLFANQQGVFYEDNVYASKTIDSVNNSRAEVIFDNVPYGNYSVIAHHDRNENCKIDIQGGLLIQEGYGMTVSLEKAIIPCFEMSMFSLESNAKKVDVIMKYPEINLIKDLFFLKN